MTFFEALFENPLLVSALLAGIAASLASGLIGSYIVVKRIVFICGSISHAVLGGIGFCVWLEKVHGITWATPLLGAIATAILAAGILGWMRLHCQEREDTAIAALWSLGMALGVLFISQTPGFSGELSNFLIGNLLWVAPEDLYALFALDAIVLVSVLCLHKRFVAICFDEEQAALQGIHVPRLYLFLLILTALSIVLLIQVVGVILAMTMLTIPAALANLFCNRLSHIMWLAVGLSALFSTSGIYFAFHLDWPSGATIAVLATSVYGLALCIRR